MTSSFLTLPLELRNIIYTYALDWPDLSAIFQKTNADYLITYEAFDKNKAPPKCTISRDCSTPLVTPTILLLNRQITSEALVILQKKILTIPSPPPSPMQLARPTDITEFIGEAVLQNVRLVTLRLNFKDHSSRHWMKTVENLLDIWCQRNNLQSLHICVEKCEEDGRGLSFAEVLGWYTRSTLARVSRALNGLGKWELTCY